MSFELLEPSALSEVLHATGPAPAHAEALALFGKFVGSWRVDNRLREPDGTWSQCRGRWDFGWVLGGLAVQDVLDCPQAPNRYPGTTIRCYNPATGAWHAVWLDPHSGLYMTLRARADDAGIVLDGTTTRGVAVRWHFFDVTDTGFRWQGRLSVGDGPLELVQEMSAQRR